MKVLMITGDKDVLTPGTRAYARLELQRSSVEKLDVLYWGRGSLWPQPLGGPFDVVTVQDPFWRGLFAWGLARRIGARLNVQVHTDLGAQPLLRRVVAGVILRHADSIRVVSEKIKKQAQDLGVHVPVHVLPIFIDIEKFRDVVRQPHEQKILLWTGRFEEEKDPALAIQMLEKVRESGIDAKLIMLGAGSMEHSLRNQAQWKPIEFPGWQDPRPYLAVADVVLSTSRHESWGASIVEALAAGVPVVALDVGIAREAGAHVVDRGQLAGEVAKVLQTSQKGELQIMLLSKEEWAKKWKESLS